MLTVNLKEYWLSAHMVNGQQRLFTSATRQGAYYPIGGIKPSYIIRVKLKR